MGRESRVHGHGPGRGRPEFHLRLLGRAVSLAGIARPTGCDDVSPVRLPPLGAGVDVVQGQVRTIEPVTTVLTLVPITPVDAGTGESGLALLTGVLPKANHGGEIDGEADALDLDIVDLHDLHLAEETKRDRTLPGDGADYLIRGVEQENCEMVGVIVHEGLRRDAEDGSCQDTMSYDVNEKISRKNDKNGGCGDLTHKGLVRASAAFETAVIDIH